MDLEYIVGIGVILILLFWVGDTLPKKYRKRSCMGKNWKSTFPSSSKEDIREFLLTQNKQDTHPKFCTFRS